MNPLKLKLLEEIMGHLRTSQATDLKSLLDDLKSKKVVPEQMKELTENGQPKGIAIEKVSVMKKPDNFDSKVNDAIESQNEGRTNNAKKLLQGEEEMTDEELEELLRRL